MVSTNGDVAGNLTTMHWRDKTIAEIAVLQTEIDDLVEEERTIRDKLSRLRSDRDRLRKRLSEPPGDHSLQQISRNDSYIVSCRELSPLIEQWRSRFDREYGIGSRGMLADLSGMTVKTINRIENDYDYVSLVVAERLLIAMGMEEAISTGVVHILNRQGAAVAR